MPQVAVHGRVRRVKSASGTVFRAYQLCKSSLGLDFHVVQTLLQRSWGVLAGVVMLVLIPYTLTPQQQGYYFTFAGLLGLQIFFELGLNQAVTVIVSREVAHLSVAEGALRGERSHVDRVRSVIGLLRRWYAVAAVLFAIAAAAVGYFMFRRFGSLPTVDWAGPWLAMVVLAAVNLFVSPLLAVIEGLGRVGQVARLRLVQAVVGNVLAWLLLLAGAGLWAAAAPAAVAAVGSLLWLRAGSSSLGVLHDATPVPPAHAVDWRREIFPFQWRLAVSWICGYLLFQIYAPLAFTQLGAVAAGQLGISLAIFNAIQAVGISWINARTPQIAGMVARKDCRLEQTFRSALLPSTAFVTLAACTVLVLVPVGWAYDVALVDRLAGLPTLACMAVTTAVNTAVYAAATYLRAHGSEPMLPVSVVAAVLTLAGVIAASFHSTLLMMLAQAVVTVCVALPWTLKLLRAQRAASQTATP